MAKRIAEIVILAEDLRQQNLARHYLKSRGYQNRRLRLVLVPGGRGSGEQFVRGNYPAEVRSYRVQASRRSAALIVLLDADVRTVQRRHDELADSLREAEVRDRQPGERIGLLIPRRNVETWVLCLTGERVNEEDDYSNRPDVQDRIREAGKNLSDWNRTGASLPDYCVESLRYAIEAGELTRIEA